ncbi:uncharacterized protein LOC130810705 [Amaranthus tricolor]|uniref:uncharacterized protein LOC130810705 n=1 Tax=Amaranthus tricolor TaxID=29722 RepID=UPI002589EA98|nr:uncharacterized protein LOC130810705 [Amaranthus tricolor]
MQKYLPKIKCLIAHFKGFEVERLPRSQNEQADALSKLGSARQHEMKRFVLLEVKQQSAIHENVTSVFTINKLNLSPWIEEMLKYKEQGELPIDPTRAKKIKTLAPQFIIVNNELYKVTKSGLLLKCVTPKEAEYILREIHEGVCGHHQGAKSLAHRAFRAAYYLPNALSDAKNGLDLLGPFPVALEWVKFLILGVNYFTKWVEAGSLATITSRKAKKFIWKHIITRFGLLIVLTMDNGKQFDCNTSKEYLNDFKINVAYSSGRWSEVLYDVLWSLRTTSKEATGQTPFRLVHGKEALLPVEIGVPTLRTQCYEENENQELRLLDLELIEEVREEAALKMAAYQNRVARLYNRKVSPNLENLKVIVRRSRSTEEPDQGNLLP